jgi:hypothetical protein
MMFMNQFVDKHIPNMKKFIDDISVSIIHFCLLLVKEFMRILNQCTVTIQELVDSVKF